ncbi:MAG TPA: crosslink repair DNA glycosylase YcaQ family protein [Thermoplasmata archaeon]|nr:crosslink repair DNA glycosylase YcaQ family protein [Thermoplasmata archaeon]
MREIEIDIPTARRFILGSQGLWPARRWKGREGLLQAIRQIGSVQVDPLDVVGHNQDLVLLSRVDGYRPAHLERALYRDRTLFEWGGNLHIRPIESLPYLVRTIRSADYLGRRARFERSHAALMAQVRRAVEARGPLGSRDLPTGERVASYRARREPGLALYYLWLRGDLMIRSREGGERQYDLTERLVPPRLLRPAPEDLAESYRFRAAMVRFGLPNASELLAVQRASSPRRARVQDRAEWIGRQERRGRLTRVRVTGWSGPRWLDADDESVLTALAEGRVPKAWTPRPTPRSTEAIFLAPLEEVSARGRSARLFDFEYLWEVYKPAAKRRWGYYVLPILLGDRLVGRMEPSRDPVTRNLSVVHLWWEPGVDPRDHLAALASGLLRMAQYLDAPGVTVSGSVPGPIRRPLVRATSALRPRAPSGRR